MICTSPRIPCIVSKTGNHPDTTDPPKTIVYLRKIPYALKVSMYNLYLLSGSGLKSKYLLKFVDLIIEQLLAVVKVMDLN